MPATQDIRAIEDVFSIWPTLADMARELEVDYQRVAKWSQRRRIPTELFPEVIVAAQRREVFLTDGLLNRLNTPRGTVGSRAIE